MSGPIKVDKLREAAEAPQQLVPVATQAVIASPFGSEASFEAAQRMALALCSSTIVPKDFQGRGNIGNALIALEVCQRNGMPMLAVMQNLDVIHGRPTWRSQFVIACINQSGRFAEPLTFVEVGKRGTDSWGMYAEAVTHSGRVVKGPTVTIGMAKAEGWYGKKGSKWQTVPELMLRYRCAGWFGRTVCPDLLVGLQSTDEVRDMGDVIDVTPVVVAPAAEPLDTQDDTVDPLAAELEAELKERGFYEANGAFINADGEVHDPEVHATDGDGLPIINKDGSFRAKRGAAKVAQEEKGQDDSPPDKDEQPAAKESEASTDAGGEDDSEEEYELD